MNGELEKPLECPFTWGMSEKEVQLYNKTDDLFVNVEDQPVKALINAVTLVYVYVTKDEMQTALQKMKDAINIIRKIELRRLEKDGIAIEILVHIVRATKFHYYKANGNSKGAQEAIKSVSEIGLKQLRDKNFVATLNGCKSLAWSVFHEVPNNIALSYASRAVLNNPDCALWHFILGRKLREIRRIESKFEPSEDEYSHLLKSFELSRNHYFGVFVAQMYWENKEFEKSKKLAMEIFNSNPQSVGIRLRLTLAFIRSKDFNYAKECLDFVQNECPNNSMFLHYKGLYFEKQQNYQMALLYFKESAKSGNYKADHQFGEMMLKLQSDFNFIDHLISMLTKYEKNPVTQQKIALNIALQFYFKKRNLKNSLIYFLKALEINSKHQQLKSYCNITIDHEYYNIFDLVYNRVLPEFNKRSTIMTNEMQNIIKRLNDIYIEYAETDNPLTEFSNMEL